MFTRLSIGIALAASSLFGTTALASESINPLQIFVSKDSQSLVVYDGDQPVATSNVSTGKAGHTTPSGIFSILEKKKTHFSNLYDSAPMPWMQRITWSGVALHESGHVPDYPASHGCVRMPRAFAKELFSMTKRGFHVVISDRPVAPERLADASLLMPRYGQPAANLVSDAELRPTIVSQSEPVLVAMNEALPKAGATAVATLPEDLPPIRILITRDNDKAKRSDIELFLDRLGYAPGPIDGQVTKSTIAAIKAYQERHGQKPTGTVTAEFVTSIYKVMNRKQPTGRLFVRRNFKPVFDAPVEIANPELALGTHFYNALNVSPAQNRADWYGVSLDNGLSEKTLKRLGITENADATKPHAALDAFKRITMTEDVRAKLEAMLGNGSSMTITDTGTESETGQGTDFITITKPLPKA